MVVWLSPKPRKAQVIPYTSRLEPTVAPYRTEVRVVLVPLSSEIGLAIGNSSQDYNSCRQQLEVSIATKLCKRKMYSSFELEKRRLIL